MVRILYLLAREGRSLARADLGAIERHLEMVYAPMYGRRCRDGCVARGDVEGFNRRACSPCALRPEIDA